MQSRQHHSRRRSRKAYVNALDIAVAIPRDASMARSVQCPICILREDGEEEEPKEVSVRETGWPPSSGCSGSACLSRAGLRWAVIEVTGVGGHVRGTSLRWEGLWRSGRRDIVNGMGELLHQPPVMLCVHYSIKSLIDMRPTLSLAL